MKKHLIAAAVAAAVAAPAMAQNVTLSGNLDFAAMSISGTQENSKGQTIATTTGTASTSLINLVASEDLGGGMKATVKYGLDPRSLANDSLSVTNNTAASGATATLGNTTTGLARDEAFVGIEGAFGNVRLGSPNSIGLTGFLVSSPLGTGIGSGYAPNASAMVNSFVNTRYNRSVRYDSPRISGLQFQVLFAPGQDVAATAGAATYGGMNALLIPNSRKTTEMALHYAAGPLTAQFTRLVQASSDNSTGYYAGAPASGATSGVATAVNILDAKLEMGSTTLYGGWHQGDKLANLSTTVTGDTSGYRLAAKQDMGSYDLIAQYTAYTQDASTTVTDIKPKVTGARVDYKFSKRTVVYAGYEHWSTDRAYASTSPTSTGNRTVGSVGLRQSF